jgi:hypothetical protein
VSGWPKRCKMARAFLWEYSCKRLQLAQLLGQLERLLTFCQSVPMATDCGVYEHGPRLPSGQA